MEKLKIVYFPKKCIGNGACEIADPAHFKMAGKKAVLVDSKANLGQRELVVSCSEEQKHRILTAGNNCPSNAIGVINELTGEELVKTKVEEKNVKEIIATYDDLKEFVMDPTGYFLIRIDNQKRLIEIGFCGKKNQIEVKIIGKKPLEIYQTAIKENLISRFDHAAYLGRELQKAFIALENGLEYVQDDELDFNKKSKV